MTETSILPGAEPSSDAGIDMVPPSPAAEEPDGDNNRRRLLILGAIAGVIVLAAAAYLLLHKSSSTPTAAPVAATVVVQPPGHHKSTGKGSNAKGSGKQQLPKEAKNAPVDPFKPLVTPVVQTNGGPASTTTVSASPSTAPTTATSPVATPTPTPTSTSTTPTGTGKGLGTPLWIQLTKTSGQSATFKVGYAKHKFRRFIVDAPSKGSNAGTVFGKVFALLGVKNQEATLQIGDGAPFELGPGISHVV
jgi:hypothetical protein